MIVKMKKITFLVAQEHLNNALGHLRSMGLIHIKPMRRPKADIITSCEHKIQLIDRVLSLLNKTEASREDLNKNQVSFYVKEVIILGRKRHELKERLKELEDKQAWYKEWGNVWAHSLIELEKRGVFVKLYLGTKKDLKQLSKKNLVYAVGRSKGKLCLGVFFDNEKDSLKLKEVEVPSESLYSLQKRVGAAKKELKEINKEFSRASGYRKRFIECREEILKSREFYKVRFGVAHEEGVCCFQGFCPQGAVSEIIKAADKQGWATIVQEPEDNEEVPTLIRTPRWIEIIKPVFKFMGTIPGYKEYDISFWFLLFFSIFFAMLVGDAGYGLLFLIATYFIKKKFKTKQTNIFSLLYVLGCSTVLWGTLTGVWFGFEKIAQLPFLNLLVIERINSFTSSNQIFMIYLCFFIGAVHLTIAHGIKAFRVINSRLALAQLGWICIVWSMFFVAGKLVLNKPAPTLASGLFILGISLVVFFSHIKKNIIKGALLALADLPLKVISSFSDVVSYLRLFAVGYATLAVAMAFNSMALGEGVTSIFSGLVAGLMLFFGHALNIVLALMAVVVHGIRLNMLEFSGHMDMEWSGIKYEPFKE